MCREGGRDGWSGLVWWVVINSDYSRGAAEHEAIIAVDHSDATKLTV